MAQSKDPSEPVSGTSWLAKYRLALHGSMNRSFGHVRKLLQSFLLTSGKLGQSLIKAAHSPTKGVFPLIGILSVLVLAVLTVGLPNGASIYWPLYLFFGTGLLSVGLLWKFSRKQYSNVFADIFGWLPVFLGALSYGYWYWYASLARRSPDSTFFHAAADVLPIILLATVVDVRRTRDLESRQLVLPIAVVFLGELAALNALAFGNAGPADFAAVASSFVSSIVALVLAVLADIAPTSDEREGPSMPSLQTSVKVDTKEPSVRNHRSIPHPPTSDESIALPAETQGHTVEEG
jgi:hypothetical protein